METPKKRLVISKLALQDLAVRTGVRAGEGKPIVFPPTPVPIKPIPFPFPLPPLPISPSGW